ncbi:hypothetical protein [Deinococcus sp. QL22]|uniref:hypothetical protein n=1 Tax=Deinococcus sp. QL22 TaxID=2939437 RepID=UPI002017FE7F|nr:hypothetical protein [Deinococcus sp. QL22]UQN10310.1 hypothetical protein M1R55_29605 [Deinococcus sp. QL22]UQN10444.1 hypothetical protein M1R55_28930 [Deinococcus sp. QL22]
MNRKQRRASGTPSYVPGPPSGEARDLRIVYGAGCTYWGDIYSIQTLPLGGHRMPACPHCRGMLYEQESEAAWMERVTAFAEQTNDSQYVAFMRWNKGRACLSLRPEQGGDTAFERLRAQFDAEARS